VIAFAGRCVVTLVADGSFPAGLVGVWGHAILLCLTFEFPWGRGESSRLHGGERWLLVEQPSSTTSTCKLMSQHNGTYYHNIHLLSLSRLGRLCAAQDAMLRRRCQYQSSHTPRLTQVIGTTNRLRVIQKRRATQYSGGGEPGRPLS
jgi:hypothetical protein